MSHIKTRLMGLAAAFALLVFVAGIPALLLTIDATPKPETFRWSTLSAPDDGTVALAVIGVVAWIAWAIFAVSVILDIASRLRSRRAPSLPGLAVPQLAAGQLVGLAALLFISVPAVTAVATVPRAAAEPPPSAPERAPSSLPEPPEAVSSPQAQTRVEARRAQAIEPSTVPYTVKRGDSLWKIAKERLGDGTRYVELVDLNRAVLGDRPDFLNPGTVLRVPLDAAAGDNADHSPGSPEYVVKPGDTLSEIAEDELGDATAYPQIVEASRSTVQPDGARLSDPNLIRPGWHLTLPSTTDQADPSDLEGAPKPDRPAPRAGRPVPQPAPPETAGPPGPSGSTSEQDRPHDTIPADGDHAANDDPAETDELLPGWMLPGLAGGGAALAGALLVVLRQHRRTQLRYRLPGRIIAPPPAELRDVEKSIHASGTVTAPRVEDLDQSLRALGAAVTPPPLVMTAALGTDAVDVVLAQPANLPTPWRGDGVTWRISLGEPTSDETTSNGTGSVAPYPLMVSVGIDHTGALVYLNLEALQTLALVGDPDRATALGRHVAAELSLNPWSTLVEIDTLGIGDELADIDPNRLHAHDKDTAFLDQLASDLEAENPAMEPDQYRTLIAAADTPDAPDEGAVRRVAKIVTSYAGRMGAAVLTIGSDHNDRDANREVTLRLTADGQLTIDALSLELLAAGLTTAEARACATLVDLTRDATNVAAPTNDFSSCSDSAGALRAELTDPRPQAGPAGPSSLLPLAVREYVAMAAVVPEDLDALTTLASAETRRQVEEQDPDLDEDVARWQASSLTGPKLTLLGPVTARTLGDPRKMAHRRPFYIELLAYLVLHPDGATANDIANAFGIRDERARKDLGVLRGWLGRDRITGEQHLPNARQTHSTGIHATYTVHGVATDLDLFKRLRTRGQSRGAAGIDDLRTALTLVSGEPFTDLRPRGWSWLLDGERLDHIMSCAIVDTGHILTTHALSVGDLDLARFSSERTYQAAPYDEIARLDIIAVAKALGADEDAERLLTDDILNRSDDDLGPIDLPAHTARVLSEQGWAGTQQDRSADWVNDTDPRSSTFAAE